MMSWLSNYNAQLHPAPPFVCIFMHALMIVPLEVKAYMPRVKLMSTFLA